MQGVQTKVDLKSLEVLEQRIQRAVDAITTLKAENAGLRTQVASLESAAAGATSAQRELDTLRTTARQLERELNEMRDERKAVIARVDGLLADLDKLGLDS